MWWTELYPKLCPKILSWCPIPTMWQFGEGDSKEVTKIKWGLKGGALSNRTGVFIRRGKTPRQRAVWGHREKAALCKSRREALGETKSANTLMLDFLPPGGGISGRNKCCLGYPVLVFCYGSPIQTQIYLSSYDFSPGYELSYLQLTTQIINIPDTTWQTQPLSHIPPTTLLLL